MELTSQQALGLRMSSLLLRASSGAGRATGMAEVVCWLGAMQAQDLASGLWSFGVRLPGWTAADVTAALERREALRTWPMRGTIHFVPPRDARWMVELMGVRVLAGAARRREQLGLSEETAVQAMEVLGAALTGGGRLSRSECLAVLAEKGIDTSGQRGYHLLWYASQRGLLCIAPNIGNEQSFVLLDEWVPDPHRPERDEALGTIALRYFRGRGPTTRQDFAGWTGLTAADAKRGIAVAGDALARVTVDGVESYLDAALLDTAPPPADDEMLVLPGFDEYLLGYKDRSLMVPDEHKAAIIPGSNGVFQSTVVRAGQVVATWKRTLTKTRVRITVQPLVPLQRAEVEQAFERYGQFMERTPEVRWP
ncbi:winged helix DNA-binding domain-containing protein [Nonomuraea sp. NPDC049649]|uniref:winged helix DNA-binding domain-containing protein n=1 Tax=Nonomuraea sp. NPDC049649 TaxID=3155776 RepID=UPI003416F3FB